MTPRRKLSAFQKSIIDKMVAGHILIRDTEGFFIADQQISKRTILSLLSKRAIKPANDGAFGRSQTYVVMD